MRLFRQQVHSFTPGELPDARAFRAEASGALRAASRSSILRPASSASGGPPPTSPGQDGGALYPPLPPPADMEGRAQEHSGRPRLRARRFRRHLQRVAIRRRVKGAARFDLLAIPRAVMSPLLAGGRSAPVQTARHLAARLASQRRHRRGERATSAPFRRTRRRRAAQPVRPCGAGLRGLRRGTGRGPDSLRAAQLAAVKRHIERRLADPGLNPASVADTVGVSVRQLHLLFEPTGATFARYVLASGCSSAGTRSPALPARADRWPTSHSAGGST